MIWHSFAAMTIADALIVASVCYAIYSFVRTHDNLRAGRPNIGLVMVLIGLALIALYYAGNLFVIYVLPSFMSVPDAWAIMRRLHGLGYWAVIGTGLVLLVCGLHFVHRDVRRLVARLAEHEAARRPGLPTRD